MTLRHLVRRTNRTLVLMFALMVTAVAAGAQSDLTLPYVAAQTFQITCNTPAVAISVPTTVPPQLNQQMTTFRIWNGTNAGGANAATVCIGGPTAGDVNMTTRCYPLCSTAACPEAVISMVAKPGVLFCMAAAPTVVTVLEAR